MKSINRQAFLKNLITSVLFLQNNDSNLTGIKLVVSQEGITLTISGASPIEIFLPVEHERITIIVEFNYCACSFFGEICYLKMHYFRNK